MGYITVPTSSKLWNNPIAITPNFYFTFELQSDFVSCNAPWCVHSDTSCTTKNTTVNRKDLNVNCKLSWVFFYSTFFPCLEGITANISTYYCLSHSATEYFVCHTWLRSERWAAASVWAEWEIQVINLLPFKLNPLEAALWCWNFAERLCLVDGGMGCRNTVINIINLLISRNRI